MPASRSSSTTAKRLLSNTRRARSCGARARDAYGGGGSAEPVGDVEVELKKPADLRKTPKTALDPVTVDRKHYQLEFENPQVRVFRVHFGPHETAPLHEHVLNRVVVYLHDQNTRMIADGKTDVAQHKAGEVSWGARPNTAKRT